MQAMNGGAALHDLSKPYHRLCRSLSQSTITIHCSPIKPVQQNQTPRPGHRYRVNQEKPRLAWLFGVWSKKAS
jgi:hypothetical protein